MNAPCRFLALAAVLAAFAAVPAAAARAPFSVAATLATYTPGSPVRVDVVTESGTDVEAAAFPLSVADAVDVAWREPNLRIPDTLLAGRRAVRTARAHVEPAAKPVTVSVGALPPGFYALRVRAGGETAGIVFVSVTTLGITTSDAGSNVAAYAVDLKTFRARADATLERHRVVAGAAETLRTGAGGIATFQRADPREAEVLVARGADGSAAVARVGPSFDAENPHSGYVQTDRPIYRPGDRVHYRAILRDGAPGALTVPSGERVVRLRGLRAKEIARATRALDAFGTLEGDFALPADAELGSYQIRVGADEDVLAAQTFAVEAYKKPEFVVDVARPAAAVGGETLRVGVAARYFFGRPAAGMKLHYRAYFRPVYVWWRRGTPFRFTGYGGIDYDADTPPAVEGDATADAAGRATLAIPTTAVTSEKELQLEIDGRDEAGRTVTAQTRAQVVPASFYLSVAPGSYFVQSGDTVELAIRSRIYAADVPRPRTRVDLKFERVSWSGREGEREPQPADATSVVTDDAGRAAVRWKPAAGGYYEITASSRDEAGRAVTTVASVWVASQRYDRAYAFDRISVVPQKEEYRPGETAMLLVTAPRAGVDALVHVIGGASERVFVTHLGAPASTVAVEPPAGVARYRVMVTAPGPVGLSSAVATVNVAPQPHRLRVAIRPAKAKYAPGERARFALHVEDADGKPVRAQIGVAVVDDAIFALRRANQADPFEVFYGATGPNRWEVGSWSRVDGAIPTYRNYNLQMIGRTTAAEPPALQAPVPPPAPAAADTYARQPSFDQLRSDFRDTAYWSPAVVTGADGSALVTFDWPDSLTSYTASGLAVTQASDVGSGAGSALVTKDFLVRLSAPRFLRHGDSARITAVAQGVKSAKSARLRFSAPLLGVADDTTTARFDDRAVASAHWDVRGGELGASSLRLAGTSGALSDGMRVALPVETSGTAQHERGAGMLPQASSLELKLRPGAEAGDLRIDLTPSALAQLAAGVRLLQVYPYYCVEQTMSAALPAVYVDRMRKRIKLPPPDGPAPAEVAKRAVDRLVKLQHPDGSWGWWEHDAANPFMSAYALYGLAELSHEGYPVPADTLARGVRSVNAQMSGSINTLAFWGGAQPNSEWNTRAFMLFALANAQGSAVDHAVLAAADAHAKELNPYALSVLGLAHVELGDRGGAQPLLAELLKRVTDDGTYAHWKGQGWHYSWQDDPIETTAYALRFVHAMTPDDPRVARTVSWLRTQQHGSWFVTTKDTAAAIYAMAEAVPVTANELDPHETVRVVVDGRVVKTVRIDAPVLPRAEASFVVPARMLRNGSSVRFEREGTGALSWSTDWTQYVHDARAAVATDPDLRVERTYTMRGGNDWHVGDTVDVDVIVTAKTEAQYVAVEDPLPAGLEYQPKQYGSGDNWSGLQFFDDRVVFFASRLSSYAPLHLRYTLRATTAGAFTAPAPTAYAMYGPPSTAMGTPAKVTIR